jgi:glutathione-independent formaldehyde dehydrogenase
MVSLYGTGKVELLEIEYPKLAGDRKCEHGVILKIIATICGSDQHMVRGRTTAEKGLVLGHEITGSYRIRERRGIYKERRYCFCSF